MAVGAVLVVGDNPRECPWTRNSLARGSEPGTLGGNPIACLEVLGQSVLDRVVDKLLHNGVKPITIVVRDEFSSLVPRLGRNGIAVNPILPPIDLWSAGECVLREYAQQGVEHILVSTVAAYAELDLAQLIKFHREQKSGVTSVADGHGPVDLWVVNGERVLATRAVGLSELMDVRADASYQLRGYSNRLRNAHDLHQLVVDAFRSSCDIRPRGREVAPGIWFDDGARAHRRARIEAPAYLGAGAKLRADTLISNFSTVERGCDVHAGTVIEYASVLPNTHVGKGLRVTNAIADGNRLFPLDRHLVVEIQDNKLLGRISPIEPPDSVIGGASSGSLAERLLATAWN